MNYCYSTYFYVRYHLFIKAKPDLTDRHIDELVSLIEERGVSCVNLSYSTLSGKALEKLSNLPIFWLSLNQASVSDDAFPILARFSDLKALQI